ncbi:uncharacterized protein LOC110986540 [Acanthaster planci]|uniref:Uncharacterized protein LOC110986540 n=1 Tax=Acanthaster planci TaxID=133434 RepID=A0A8B7ZGP3_ACAPL|nr:uncharacterized protein LOC110986540 [Acanthaster planci]
MSGGGGPGTNSQQPKEDLDNSYLFWLAGNVTPKQRFSLGLKLHFSPAEIAVFEEDYRGDTKRQIFEMLVRWHNRQEGDELSKVRLLGQALADDEVGRADLKKILYKDYHVEMGR